MQRIPALSGVIFVVLFVLAVVAYAGGAGSDPAGISAYYARPASWRHQELGFALMLAACLFLIVYLAVLARLLPATGPARTIATISAAVHVGLLIAANALWASSAFFADIEGVNHPVDPTTHLMVEDAGYAALVSAAAAAIPVVLAVSWHAWKDRAQPDWYAALGLAAAAGLAGTYWYFPLAAFLLWLVAGSVLLSRDHAHELAAGG